MESITLNHAHPSVMEARYIAEVKKMTPQQRFEKLMAIIEISYLLKTSPKMIYKNNILGNFNSDF